MAEDTSPQSSNEAGGSGRSSGGNIMNKEEKAPVLKRGTACANCRKRKMKCDAGKPGCENCRKSRMECEYVILKPKSRVTVLEQKIADLESLLLRHDKKPSLSSESLAGGNNHGTSSSWPYPSQTYSATSTAPVPNDFNAVMADFQPSNELENIAFQPDFANQVKVEPTGNSIFEAEQNAISPPWFLDSSFPIKSLNSKPLAQRPQVSPPLSQPPNQPAFSFSQFIPTDSPTSPPSANPFATSTGPPLLSDMLKFNTSNPGQPDIPQPPVDNKDPALFVSKENVQRLTSTPETEANIDIENLPNDLRDHLIQLFLKRRRQLGGLNIHLPRFLASLDGPDDSKPHPALLHAIYCTSSRLSPLEYVRKLEHAFLTSTKKKIDQGLVQCDRLINVTQASVILCLYYTSLGIYPLAFQQSGISMKLISCCGLNRISSPVWKAPESDRKFSGRGPLAIKNINVMTSLVRKRANLVPDAKDSIELYERMATFWLAYSSDRISSTITGWSVSIADEDIETPFLQSLEKFERGEVTEDDRRGIYELFHRKGPVNRPEDYPGTLMPKALCLLHRVSTFYDPFCLPSCREDYFNRPAASSPHSSLSSSSHSPGTSTSNNGPFPPPPSEIVEMREIINEFIATLPAQFKDPSAAIVGGIPSFAFDDTPHDAIYDQLNRPSIGISPATVTLHTILYCILQLLWSDDMLASWNQDTSTGNALKAARGVVALINSVSQIDFSEFDMILAPLWTLTSRQLLREAQRQVRTGEDTSLIEIEIEVVLLALKRLGQLFDIGNSQATFIKTLSDFTAMTLDDTVDPGEIPNCACQMAINALKEGVVDESSAATYQKFYS